MSVDMSAAAISARIREVADRSDLHVERMGEAKVDYSPAAISARIREAAQLLRLCQSLGRAKLAAAAATTDEREQP